MAYSPNPNREVKDGKAMVSAKELADFKEQYGADKTLRDLLNADKGLKRRDGSAPTPASAKESTSTPENPKENPRFDPASVSSEDVGNSMLNSLRRQRESDASGETAKTNAKLEAANKLTNKDASKSEPPRFKSPIVKFFEGIRERGNKDLAERGMKKGGKVKKMASGGSASSRADGIASKGKTRGKMC